MKKAIIQLPSLRAFRSGQRHGVIAMRKCPGPDVFEWDFVDSDEGVDDETDGTEVACDTERT